MSDIITPVGGLSLSLTAVQTTITACPSWQAWVGVNALPTIDRMPAARLRTHLFGLPMPSAPDKGYTRDELEVLRPACVLTHLPPAFLTRTGVGYRRRRTALEHFIEGGIVYAHVIADVSEAIDDDALALLDFTNGLGLLIDDMLEQSEIPGSAYLQDVSVVVEPNRVPFVQVGTQGDFINAMLKVEWGLG